MWAAMVQCNGLVVMQGALGLIVAAGVWDHPSCMGFSDAPSRLGREQRGEYHARSFASWARGLWRGRHGPRAARKPSAPKLGFPARTTPATRRVRGPPPPLPPPMPGSVHSVFRSQA